MGHFKVDNTSNPSPPIYAASDAYFSGGSDSVLTIQDSCEVNITGDLTVTGGIDFNLDGMETIIVPTMQEVTIRGRKFTVGKMGILEAMAAALISLNDPRVDDVLRAADLNWKDANGREIFPGSIFDQLADAADSDKDKDREIEDMKARIRELEEAVKRGHW